MFYCFQILLGMVEMQSQSIGQITGQIDCLSASIQVDQEVIPLYKVYVHGASRKLINQFFQFRVHFKSLEYLAQGAFANMGRQLRFFFSFLRYH